MTNELETYSVHVKVIGHWYEEYQVEAESEEDARDRWLDGDQVQRYEHCTNETEVYEVERY
jgi:hypothetical protein|tara:strand:- start:247 stop:429 length:183 start_codon:yes stop_codon:yes gene_type:complete